MKHKSIGITIFWWAIIIIAVRILLFSMPVLINAFFMEKFLTGKGVDWSILGLTIVSLFCFVMGAKKVLSCKENKKSFQKSILIIDDDESIIKTVRAILISQGYSVLAASSGENGLKIAQNQKPDLILLDVILPGVKGRDVCKQLKEDVKTKNIPVVFLTSKDSEDDIQAEKEVGGEGHLTKPVDAKMLIAAIHNILQ